ncbi:uncharacterized protein LOC101456602 [Ceratitis capitata]|nr:uncharacterized protein LOC101456602 [Ceratitis capitata]
MSLLDVLEMRAYFDLLEQTRDQSNAIPWGSGNYIIRHDLAYTEDFVLVKNIYVTGIPNHVIPDFLEEYFKKFGKIKSIKILNGKQWVCTKGAYIHYVDAEAACRVLRKSHHFLCGGVLEVDCCFSWKQPNADKACRPPISPAKLPHLKDEIDKCQMKSMETTNGLSLLSLDDDCLEIICRGLKPKEQVRFARVCPRLENVFAQYCRRAYKILVLENIIDLTVWEARDFFRFAGEYIEELKGGFHHKFLEEILNYIVKYCPRLVKINLGDTALSQRCYTRFMRRLPQIRELSFNYGYYKDNSILSLQNLKHLESLAICRNEGLTGKFICRLGQITDLCLYDLNGLEPEHLVDICKSLKNLRSLDIRRCERISAQFYRNIENYCQNLEVLKITCPKRSYEHLALLPKLKQLDLVFAVQPQNDIPIIGRLVTHKADQLEVLNIYTKNHLSKSHINLISQLTQLKELSVAYNQVVDDIALQKLCNLKKLEVLTIAGCSDATKDGVLALLEHCPKLREIRTQHCKQITCEFVTEAIDILQARRLKGNQETLKLFAHDTSLTKDSKVFETKKYELALSQSLIKIDLIKAQIGLENFKDIHPPWVDYYTEDELSEEEE